MAESVGCTVNWMAWQGGGQQTKWNAQDIMWRTLSQTLLEFCLAQTQYPNKSLCVLNEKLVVYPSCSFSLRNCADFCWLLCCEPVKRSGVKVPIFGIHFCVTQLLIYNNKDLPHSSSILLLILLRWIGAGQNTTNHLNTTSIIFAFFIHFYRIVSDSPALKNNPDVKGVTWQSQNPVCLFLCWSKWNLNSSVFNCPQLWLHPCPESLFSAACFPAHVKSAILNCVESILSGTICHKMLSRHWSLLLSCPESITTILDSLAVLSNSFRNFKSSVQCCKAHLSNF